MMGPTFTLPSPAESWRAQDQLFRAFSPSGPVGFDEFRIYHRLEADEFGFRIVSSSPGEGVVTTGRFDVGHAQIIVRQSFRFGVVALLAACGIAVAAAATFVSIRDGLSEMTLQAIAPALACLSVSLIFFFTSMRNYFADARITRDFLAAAYGPLSSA